MSPPIDELLSDIARRLKLGRPLAFLDLETTGVAVDADRIVEIAVALVHPDGRVVRWSRIVDPGVPIPAAATAVHGIGADEVRGQPTFAALARELAALLSGADLAGFNIAAFDLPMLSAEFARAGVPFGAGEARVVDAMVIFHRNERRDLDSAVRQYRLREHKGHRASVDVDATIDVLHAQLGRYDFLGDDVAGISAYCLGRPPGALTDNGKIVWRDGAARIAFGKHSGKTLQALVETEANYLRWILGADFPADMKRLIEEALAGRFPSEPAA